MTDPKPQTDATLTDAELDELLRLAAAATLAPWVCGPGPYYEVMDAEDRPVRASWFGQNARFIAAARTAVPALVVELVRLRAALARLALVTAPALPPVEDRSADNPGRGAYLSGEPGSPPME